MKNIPLFTTEYGVASLILQEIPYTKTAYVRIQDSLQPEQLIEECRSFCSICGAEHIFAAGHPALATFPFHTSIVKMRCLRQSLPETDAALWPVLPENLETWRSVYNKRMAGVPNASWMTAADGKKLLEEGSGYFIHRSGTLLGIGKAGGSTIEAVASCCPGAGRDVVLALNHVLTGDLAVLEVASTNAPAVSLYEKLGFLACEELSRWFCLSEPRI